jgi:hypothetical protein
MLKTIELTRRAPAWFWLLPDEFDTCLASSADWVIQNFLVTNLGYDNANQYCRMRTLRCTLSTEAFDAAHIRLTKYYGYGNQSHWFTAADMSEGATWTSDPLQICESAQYLLFGTLVKTIYLNLQVVDYFPDPEPADESPDPSEEVLEAVATE